MIRMHFIENNVLYRPVAGTENEWTSGTWTMKESKAKEMMDDGQILLHTSQNSECFLGGTVLGYEYNAKLRRATFRFRLDKSLIRVTTTDRDGKWGNEQKTVYLEADKAA